jgi:hypothetical protein
MSPETVHLEIVHVDKLASGLSRMFDQQLHTDVTFVVSGSQPVGAHRVVLASQSDYFDCLLYGPMREGRASQISLEDTPAEAFRELLRFIYSGSVSSVDLTTAMDLHILADRFGFPHLKEGIETRLASIISVENVLHFHSHAQVSSAPLLQEKCEAFMDLHAKKVIASRALPHLPKESLKMLVARDTFVVEEIQIFDAVSRWIERNGADRSSASDLLGCVRLGEIHPEDLQARVQPSGLYERERVQEAMGAKKEVERDHFTTRGKTGDDLNLLKERGTKVTMVSNYQLELLPSGSSSGARDWSCVCDYLFSLSIPATRDPGHITVKFDDVYIVNELTFSGYLPEEEGMCLKDASRENSPFCYQVWVSRDGDQWTTILDYSRLKCYSVQKLLFRKMAIRYVRLLQTKGKENFRIHFESCSYVGPVPYYFRGLGVIAPFIPMTPDFRQFVRHSEKGCMARVFLTFTQPYSVTTARVQLHGLEGCRGEVVVRVATQNRTKAYQHVVTLENADLGSSLLAEFTERPVSIVSLTLSHMRHPHQLKDPPSVENVIPQFHVQRVLCQATEY